MSGRRSSSCTARARTTRRSGSSGRGWLANSRCTPSTAEGAGASGDTEPYAIAREFEDVAAVAEAVAAETGGPVPVFGHSHGGRTALGAALLTDRIGRVISYEGAPTPPGTTYQATGLDAELRALLAAGDAAARAFDVHDPGRRAWAKPSWPRTRPTRSGRDASPRPRRSLRELEAERDPAGSLEVLARVRQPVLQLLGGESLPVFREATLAYDARLANGRVVVIAGARHAAHHTHPDAVVAAVRDFLADDEPARARLSPMLEMDILGWIVVGFLAGAISGALMGGKTARGCLPNILVGILGGVIGGWLAGQMNLGQVQGFIAALVVAVFGALVVRLVLNAISSD